MNETAFDDILSFTFDVEWSCQAVVDDVRALLDERAIRGTFFVTHAGVDVGAHERALHPNFRRNGDTYRMLADAGERSDGEVYEHVVHTTLAFAPEAKGVRGHGLHFDSTLLPIYRRAGIEYEASLRLELVPHLRPFWKQDDVVEIPAYYADYFDIVTGATGFAPANLRLAQPGMKVFDFHPNLIYANVPDRGAYEALRSAYHDPERLLAGRWRGKGTRTLFVELLDWAAERRATTATTGEINAALRRLGAAW